LSLHIHKFGGTSVGSAARIAAVADLLRSEEHAGPMVVVSSAMTGVTDGLIAAARAARSGDRDGALGALEAIRDRHLDVLVQLDASEEVAAEIEALCDDARAVLRASLTLGELTPRASDRLIATGEKLAVRLLAHALRGRGTPAQAVDADTFLDTDDHFGAANPVGALADRTAAAVFKRWFDAGVLPVVTGFLGRAPDGATTTLGRGGSDFSATLLAAALRADEVTIWTDVDGVFSADPRLVPEARPIAQLHYREAAEMSFYGAKVLHQRTMIPAATHNIPVRTRNTLNPDAPGTLVDAHFTPGSHPVKAITAVRNQALLSVEGKGMAGVPGIAARLFGALAERDISVTMISQSSSESSISLVVPGDQAREAETAIKQPFRDALARGDIEEVVRRDGVGLVAAVGLGMAHTPGIAARVFAALASERLNVLAIAQGSSELNISLAIDDAEVPTGLRALHQHFGLDRIDTGLATPRGMDLMLLGCGQIGRELLHQLFDTHAHAWARFDLVPRVVAVADRSGFLLDPTGLSREELDQALAHKADGGALCDLPRGVPATSPDQMVKAAMAYRLSRPVLIDVSDADRATAAFGVALARGADVVTANKKPLAGDYGARQHLLALADHERRLLRAEATVGAGLPVLDTLDILLATGDRLHRAMGCLSGTLGYVMTRLQDGLTLSMAVREAVKLGYTEPDPVADLSGMDVARKALILGRAAGLADANTRLDRVGLVPDDLAGLPLDELYLRLAGLDEAMYEALYEAKARGEVLRYVADVSQDSVRVGLQSVPADSPLGALRGTDNLIVFTSDRYDDRPLVISGPGAGARVTAMGVLGDIFRVAAVRS